MTSRKQHERLSKYQPYQRPKSGYMTGYNGPQRPQYSKNGPSGPQYSKNSQHNVNMAHGFNGHQYNSGLSGHQYGRPGYSGQNGHAGRDFMDQRMTFGQKAQ